MTQLDLHLGSINRGARMNMVLSGQKLTSLDTVPFHILNVEPYEVEPYIYLINFIVGDDHINKYYCATAAKDELDACAMAVDKVKDIFGATNVRWKEDV